MRSHKPHSNERWRERESERDGERERERSIEGGHKYSRAGNEAVSSVFLDQFFVRIVVLCSGF
jgi:hypothetical protein